MKTKLIIIFTLLLIAALAFTRFYNLPATSRFTRDESSNLMDMHRIFVEKKLTLVGPIDVANYIIYPSLTFYMLMPFAIIGKFSTFSPAYGTAFYGILFALLIAYLTKLKNTKLLLPISILLVVWYPLVESSRWAWNPHLVPFVTALGLILWLRKEWWLKFFAAICFGLAFHLHYYSLVSSAVFLTISCLFLIKEKRIKEVLLATVGFVITIIPFVIFDLRNPPGLFFGRFLHNNLVSENFSTKVARFGTTIPQNIEKALTYLAQNPILAIIVGILILTIFVIDIKNKNKSFIYFLPFVIQIIAIALLPDFAGRYVLLGITFLLAWIIEPRKGISNNLSKLLIIILIIGSLLHINDLLTKPQIEPGAGIVEYASQDIADSIKSRDLKNVNLAILDSPDPDPLGITYRQTLLVKEVRFLNEGQYGITDNLFVVSTSSESKIRSDQASIINGFRKGKLVEVKDISGTNWRVYLFNRDPKTSK